MNQKMKRLIACLIMLAGGILFIVFSAISFREIGSYPQTTAVVESVESEWTSDETESLTFHVVYTVDGKEYHEILQNTKTNLKKGDTIKVYYKPDDPTYVSGATKGLAILQLSLGSLFAVVGLLSTIRTICRP